jgi:hypothetical protein
MKLVENICPAHDLLMYIIYFSYKNIVTLNSENLVFAYFLFILRKFLHAKEIVKLFIMFLTIAAVYGNEFVTSSKST